MKSNITDLILKHPRINLMVIAVISLVFILLLAGLKRDTSLSAFVIRNDPDMLYYNKIKSIFQTDETVVIGFAAPGLFENNDLHLIKRISDEIKQIQYVRNVRSLTEDNLITATEEMFTVSALAPSLPLDQEQRDLLRRHATENILYVKDIASQNGRYGSILVEIMNVPEVDSTQAVIRSIKEILKKESARSDITFHLVGDSIINYALGEYMQHDLFTSTLPLFILIALLLKLTFGNKRDILIALITISICLLWTMGSIALLGKTLNNVTIGLMPLILCIALEDIYYIQYAYYGHLENTHDQKAAFIRTFDQVMAPCFFTSLTTVIGFGTLMINNIKPILDFGLLGSLAVLAAFIISIVLIPSVHLCFGPAPYRGTGMWLQSLLDAIARLVVKTVTRRPFGIAVIVAAVVSLAVAGIAQIRIDTDHLSFFHKKSQVYQSTNYVEKNLAGASILEVVVDTAALDGIKQPEILREIEKLALFLRKLDGIDKVFSIVDFLKDMNRAMHNHDNRFYSIPATKELVAQYLLVYSMSERRNDVEKDFVDYPYQLTRIRCRISEHNSTAILAMIQEIKHFAAKHIDPALQVHMTSYPVIYSNMVDAMARGQVQSLGLVFIGLLLAASFYFKSLKTGVLAMLPNIIPIAFTMGVMGWCGVTLNVGTAMISSIAIGLAVNDTCHFLTLFKETLDGRSDYEAAITTTLKDIGAPMIYSSICMMAGYLVFVLSQFRLTVLFGLLCALTIGVALISDLVVTPWLLYVFKPDLAGKEGLAPTPALNRKSL